jgi:hypothetical protein
MSAIWSSDRRRRCCSSIHMVYESMLGARLSSTEGAKKVGMTMDGRGARGGSMPRAMDVGTDSSETSEGEVGVKAPRLEGRSRKRWPSIGWTVPV